MLEFDNMQMRQIEGTTPWTEFEARPTIEGIRAGRDEVLETAIRQILGDGASDEAIRKMIKQ